MDQLAPTTSSTRRPTKKTRRIERNERILDRIIKKVREDGLKDRKSILNQKYFAQFTTAESKLVRVQAAGSQPPSNVKTKNLLQTFRNPRSKAYKALYDVIGDEHGKFKAPVCADDRTFKPEIKSKVEVNLIEENSPPHGVGAKLWATAQASIQKIKKWLWFDTEDDANTSVKATFPVDNDEWTRGASAVVVEMTRDPEGMKVEDQECCQGKSEEGIVTHIQNPRRQINAQVFGIPNLCQTCYFGASLQVVLSAELFIDRVFECAATEKVRHLRNFILSGDENRKESLSILFEDNGHTYRQFTNPREQSCAAELMELYLASLDNETDPMNFGDGIASTSFAIIVEEKFLCSFCETSHFEQKKLSIQRCAMRDKEVINTKKLLEKSIFTDMEICCGLCGVPNKPQIKINYFPDYILLSVQRFDELLGTRLQSQLVIEPMVRISNYPQLEKKATKEQQEEQLYSLKAIVSHDGMSAFCGHYTAAVRKNALWFHCNDANVTPCSEYDAITYGKKYASVLMYAKEF